ncbi:TPA: WxL domain-containing protein [Enterococcus faecium]
MKMISKTLSFTALSLIMMSLSGTTMYATEQNASESELSIGFYGTEDEATEGELKFLKVPTAFDFGQHNNPNQDLGIGNRMNSYYEPNISEESPVYLTIEDSRNIQRNWSVRARATMTNSSDLSVLASRFAIKASVGMFNEGNWVNTDRISGSQDENGDINIMIGGGSTTIFRPSSTIDLPKEEVGIKIDQARLDIASGINDLNGEKLIGKVVWTVDATPS